MIQLYSGTAKDFDKNGIVLMPQKTTIKEVAAAQYELTLTHPVDPRGIWALMKPGELIKAPAPTANIEQISNADTLDVYKITSETGEIKSGTQDPTRITYSAWYPSSDADHGEIYDVGEKVTFLSVTAHVGGTYDHPVTFDGDGHNYQCIRVPVGDDADYPPADMPTYWQRISDTTGGSPTILSLKKGDEFYVLEDVNASWYRVSTFHGIEGYIKKSQCEFSRTIKNEPIDPSAARDQLFRIYKVAINSKTHTVEVNARHVFYDLAGLLVDNVVIKALPPSVALAFIQTSLMDEYDHVIATNLTQEKDGDFTQTYAYCNGVAALLDKDTGFVPTYKARLLRDNWDVYIYRNDTRDRGLRLEYGKNLRGVNWTLNAEKLVTRVVPVAHASDGSDLFLQDRFVDSPIADSYPVMLMEYMQIDGKVGEDDLSDGKWTVDTLREYMRAEALKRFDVDKADNIIHSIKVDFTLLGDTEEYRQFRELQKLYLYDTVTIVDKTIGLNQKLQVSEYEWDAINLRYNSIRLGEAYDYSTHSISGSEIKNGTIRIDKLMRGTLK